MNNSDRNRLIKILANWSELQDELQKRDIRKEDLLNDRFLQWAVTTPLYNIGEHTNNLSHEFVESYPKLPWKKVAGLRHRLVHHYEETNWSIITEVIYKDMPEYIRGLNEILAEE